MRPVTAAGRMMPQLPMGITAAQELMLMAGRVRSENQAKPCESKPGTGRKAILLTAMTTVMKTGSCKRSCSSGNQTLRKLHANQSL